MYKEPELDNSIEIDSVSTFISAIKELRESADGASTELYFRGQEAEFWDIEPSIFRNDMLSIEDKLMQIPLQKIPMEFKEIDSVFDIMAKYQHYGMCTRLLDLTTNPLVALYFACKIHGLEKYETEDGSTEHEPYGVVYYTNKYYPMHSTSREIKIIAALASYDLNKENKIGMVLDKLKRDNLIDDEMRKRWATENGISEFITIIQRNYMVIPTYINERLKRQCGVFLLASMFSIDINENKSDGVVTKTKNNLRDDFAHRIFYIRGENKGEILKELDLYNINEATLFPELEHQLNYIRSVNEEYTQSVAEFFRYEEKEIKEDMDIYIDDDELNQYVISNLEEKLKDIVEKDSFEEIKSVIESNMDVDWYKRNSRGKIVNKIARYYRAKGKDKEEAKKKAKEIINIINKEVKSFIAKKCKGDE